MPAHHRSLSVLTQTWLRTVSRFIFGGRGGGGGWYSSTTLTFDCISILRRCRHISIEPCFALWPQFAPCFLLPLLWQPFLLRNWSWSRLLSWYSSNYFHIYLQTRIVRAEIIGLISVNEANFCIHNTQAWRVFVQLLTTYVHTVINKHLNMFQIKSPSV